MQAAPAGNILARTNNWLRKWFSLERVICNAILVSLAFLMTTSGKVAYLSSHRVTALASFVVLFLVGIILDAIFLGRNE